MSFLFTIFFFNFGVCLTKLKHPMTTLTHWMTLLVLDLDERHPTPFFCASSCVNSSFILLSNCSNLCILPLLIWPLVYQLMYMTTCPSPLFLSFFCLLGRAVPLMAELPFIPSAICSSCVRRAVVHWQCKQVHLGRRDSGHWPGSRKGTGTKIGSLLNLTKNFAFLCWSLLLFTWALVHVTPHRIS